MITDNSYIALIHKRGKALVRILLNAAKCRNCQTTIVSAHRNCLQSCSCGRIGIDGGKDHLYRVGDLPLIEERAIYVAGELLPRDAREYDGKFIIWSPSENKPSKTIFSHRHDAESMAKELSRKFGGSFYVAGPLSAI